MSHTVTPQIDPPDYTADTVVEISSAGDLDPVLGAPQRNQGKLGSILAMHAQGIRDTSFDPAKEDECDTHREMVDAVEDALLGSTDALEPMDLPYCSEQVEPAVEAMLTNRPLLTANCPVVAAEVPWTKVESVKKRLKRVRRRKAHLERCLENTEFLEAHLLTFLSDTATRTFKLSFSTIDGNRTMRTAFAPLTKLVRGAAEKAQDTKRVVATALKRDAKKAITLVPVHAGATDAAKDAPAKDVTKP